MMGFKKTLKSTDTQQAIMSLIVTTTIIIIRPIAVHYLTCIILSLFLPPQPFTSFLGDKQKGRTVKFISCYLCSQKITLEVCWSPGLRARHWALCKERDIWKRFPHNKLQSKPPKASCLFPSYGSFHYGSLHIPVFNILFHQSSPSLTLF